MAKNVNRYTSNEFHDWQRMNLPTSFVLQDIDTWALVWANSSYEPFALVELKRSFMDPEKWAPYFDDRPNYAALFSLAKRASMPLWIVYFKKDCIINDDSLFAIFSITSMDVNATSSGEWMTFNKKIISAKDFRDKFPKII